ncbi:IclR family KDG regulon transcriptional repressor [Bradyrhizobium sp. GM24.11]
MAERLNLIADEGDDSQIALDGRIKSVALTFRVIEELANAGEPIGVTEVARRVGEAKARIHRHLLTLRDLGILAQDKKSERYRLGWKLFQLGQAVASQSEIQTIADPHLRRLRDKTKLTALLAVPSNDQMIVVHVVESESPIAIVVRKGLLLPAHASAHGRLMLAFSKPEFADRVLSKPLRQLAPGTLVDLRKIRKRMERGRTEFYDSTENETAYGVNSIAAPILTHENELVGAIGIAGTHLQIAFPLDPGLVSLVRNCAANISAELGSNAFDRFSD